MLLGALTAGIAALAVAAVILHAGWFNVSAGTAHTQAVYWVLEQGMRASVRHHAAGVRAPEDFDEGTLRLGAHCFHRHCVQCHGGPGVAPDALALALQPIPSSLLQTARDWPVEHIYWVTRNGIRMTGMPAWEFRLGDRELWAVAGFVDRELPHLSAEAYRDRVREAGAMRCEAPDGRRPPDAERGLVTLRHYGCHGCHVIPGIVGPDVHVGPSLRGFARREVIAGRLPNTREHLVRWLRDPHGVSPASMMPDLGLTPQHAADIAAYLEALQ